MGIRLFSLNVKANLYVWKKEWVELELELGWFIIYIWTFVKGEENLCGALEFNCGSSYTLWIWKLIYEYERKNVVELELKSDIKSVIELKIAEKLCGATHKFNWGSYYSLLMWKLFYESQGCVSRHFWKKNCVALTSLIGHQIVKEPYFFLSCGVLIGFTLSFYWHNKMSPF